MLMPVCLTHDPWYIPFPKSVPCMHAREMLTKVPAEPPSARQNLQERERRAREKKRGARYDSNVGFARLKVTTCPMIPDVMRERRLGKLKEGREGIVMGSEPGRPRG